jgi:hypothetical protein
MSWSQVVTFLSLPVSTMLLAISLRLVELHPKPGRREGVGDISEQKPLSRKPLPTGGTPPAD